MDEIRIKEFLKSMRLVFINAGIYRGDHPAFRRSIDQFSDSLRALTSVKGSIEIGIKPQELVIEGKALKDDKVYRDTAEFFHVRKIKSLVIRPGATSEELTTFFLEISVAPQQLFQEGSAQAVLKKKGVIHVGVQSLDYSPLLNSGGGSGMDGDVWAFMLDNLYQTDFSRDDARALVQLRNVLEDLDFSREGTDHEKFAKLKKLIVFLKEKWPGKKDLINKELLRLALSRKNQVAERKMVIRDLSLLLKDLDPEAALDVLWEKVFEKEDFSSVVFNVFSSLTGSSPDRSMSERWNQKMKSSYELIKSEAMQKKIKDILVLKDSDTFVSEMYNATLSFLSRSLEESGTVSFSPEEIRKSSLYVELNMLKENSDSSQTEMILSAMLDTCSSGGIFSDSVFIRSFLEVLEEKISGPGPEGYKKNLLLGRSRFLSIIEAAVLDQDQVLAEPDFEVFAKYFSTSSFSRDHYLERLLSERESHLQVLRMYNLLFPDAFAQLSRHLRLQISNPRMFARIVDSLSAFDSAGLFKLLREIYPSVNALLKVELLKKMNDLSYLEKDFVFENLDDANPFIKQEAVRLLGKLSDRDLEQGLGRLFCFFNPLGIFNSRLAENIRLVGEAGLKNADRHLRLLAGRWFLWDGDKVKKEIKEALDKLKV